MLSKIIVQTYLHNLGMEEELQGVGDEEEREQSCPLQLCLEDTQSGCYVLGAVSETGCSGSSRATSGEYSSSFNDLRNTSIPTPFVSNQLHHKATGTARYDEHNNNSTTNTSKNET